MFADVTSANIVGYMNKGLTIPQGKSDAYYILTPMFNGISLEGMNLDNIRPTDETLAEGTMLMMVWTSTDRQQVATYTWKPDTELPFPPFFVPAGWYIGSDKVTDKVFKAGEAFMLNCTVPVTLTFNGEVKQSEPKFTANAKGYYRVGNLNPTPVNIQDIIPTSTEGKVVEGDVLLMTYDAKRIGAGTYTWKEEAELPFPPFLVEAGWYVGSERVENVVFNPGDGFVLDSSVKNNITLTFPSPVAQKAE